jgi:hypothetical protein
MVDCDITPALEARIDSECPGFATVDEAWFSDWVDDYSEETPAAYVYLAEDSAEKPNELGQRQATAQVYGVYIICETGDTFRAQREEVRKALFGWQPVENGAVMAFHSGQMQEIRGRYIQWREYWTLETPNALTASRPRTVTI